MSIQWTRQQCIRRLAQSRKQQAHRWLRFTSNISSQSPLDNANPISPFLLSRARATAAEHAVLTSKLASTYDSSIAKRVGELTPVTSALATYDTATSSMSELQSLLHDPSSDDELRSLASTDLTSTAVQLEQASLLLTRTLIPVHPFAHLPCLLEIRPGVGGNEAALFAADLLRMYTAYCSSAGMHTTLLKYEAMDGMADPAGSDAPMSEAILEVTAPGAYGQLRCEAGVHRVQRVPATESKGRTHTSVATVLVLPSFPESGSGAEDEIDFDDPNSDYYIHPSDVRTDVMRARGAGGQHVNTTDSAVRLTHIPTGTVVAIQDGRSQHKNRAKAWSVLRAKLAQAKRVAAGGVGKTGRGDKVRTYNWGQQRVTDHRSGFGLAGALDEVMDGGQALERIMESVRGWMIEQEVQGLVAEEAEKKRIEGENGKAENK